MTNFEKVGLFMKTFGQEVKTKPSLSTDKINQLRINLIREELVKSKKIFKNIGSAAILMDVNNGNILSMISLPDYDLNKREKISDLKFINRATKAYMSLDRYLKLSPSQLV